MSLPFSFTGVTRVGRAPGVEVFGKLSAALIAEGAHDVRRVGDAIEFRGITGQAHTSPLTNIDQGRIKVDDRGAPLTLNYTIIVERWTFVFPVLVTVVGFIPLAVGGPNRGIFFLFGVGIFVVSCVNSLVIRFRFPRWLRNVLAEA